MTTFNVIHERIDVTMLDPREPDPKWRVVDAQGHEHRWVDGKLPTLEVVVDETYWCYDCRDEHTREHLACRLCLEPVTPGDRAAPQPVLMGPSRYMVDEVEVPFEVFRVAFEEASGLAWPD